MCLSSKGESLSTLHEIKHILIINFLSKAYCEKWLKISKELSL